MSTATTRGAIISGTKRFLQNPGIVLDKCELVCSSILQKMGIEKMGILSKGDHRARCATANGYWKKVNMIALKSTGAAWKYKIYAAMSGKRWGAFDSLYDAVEWVTKENKGRKASPIAWFHVPQVDGKAVQGDGHLAGARGCPCGEWKKGCDKGLVGWWDGVVSPGGVFVLNGGPLAEGESCFLDTGFGGEVMASDEYLRDNYGFHDIGFMVVEHGSGKVPYRVGVSERFPMKRANKDFVVCHCPIEEEKSGVVIGMGLLGESCIAFREKPKDDELGVLRHAHVRFRA